MTHTVPKTSTRTSTGRLLAHGAVLGVIASLAMAMYAMVAAWEKGVGFFTPLHHIASLWASQSPMMSSMESAMAGDAFTITVGTALLGAVIHMATGAAYGVLFVLVVSRLRFGAVLLAVVGVLYGLLVFAVSAFVGLPLAAAIFDSGDQISSMAEMAGWGTFLGEHLLFGLVLGLLVAFHSRTHRG